MSHTQPSDLALATLCLAACGPVLHAFAASRMAHLLKVTCDEPADTPPLTLWRALKSGVPRLDAKLEALVQASRPGDQILIGVDAGSAEQSACAALCGRRHDRNIVVVPCEPGRAPNPKISKFLQMEPFASHGDWLLTDSEAIPDGEFLEGFRREWAASGASAQTAGYRFTNLRNAPQVLDASPALLTLWPGLMLTPINFTLGACTGIKAADLHAIGGWAAVAGELAEDNRLGALLVQAGRTIRLSRHVLTLDSDPLGWTDYLRHQHRVAVTYRATAPAGALGLPIIHTVALAALASILDSRLWISSALIVAIRIAFAATVSRLLKFPIPLLPIATVLGSVVETAMWLCAWFSPCVWWAGRWRRLGWRGRLERWQRVEKA